MAVKVSEAKGFLYLIVITLKIFSPETLLSSTVKDNMFLEESAQRIASVVSVFSLIQQLSPVKLRSVVICPGGQSSCRDGQRCCRLSGGNYGCCPNIARVVTVFTLIQLPSVEKTCPGNQSSCPDDQTCCPLSTGYYGCCPLPNAVCCNDKAHCCPEGTFCGVGGICYPLDSD